jgi:hypothetical protein
MDAYFFDSSNRYIGKRALNSGEAMPANAVVTPVTLEDGEEAYLVNGEWVISDIEIHEQPEHCGPSMEECIAEAKSLAESTSIDFMGFMDWYFTTHPDEA